MICPNCGSNLPEKALFCTNCGTKLTPPTEEAPKAQDAPETPAFEQNQPVPEVPSYPQQDLPVTPVPQNGPQPGVPNGFEQGMNPFMQPQQPKKKKSLLWLWITLGAVAIIGIIAAIIFFVLGSSRVSVDLNKYVSCSFEGYNEYGTSNLNFEFNEFIQDYSGKIHYNNDKKTDAIADFAYLIDGETDADDGALSNGDVVTLSWNLDKESIEETFNVKLEYSEMTFTVEGLEDVEVFDPFEGLEVTFSGTNGSGYMSVNTSNCTNEAARDLWFDYDYRSDYSNGETVTITFDPYSDLSDLVDEYGAAPYPTSKDYTVEGLIAYLEDDTLLTDEALANFKAQAENIYTAYVAKSFDDETLNNLSYAGYAFMTTKDTISDWDNNRLYIVYKANITAPYTDYSDGKKEKTETRDIYWYAMFEGVVMGPDGTIAADLQDYSTPWDSVSFEHAYSWIDGYESIDTLRKKVCDANVVDWNIFDHLGN